MSTEVRVPRKVEVSDSQERELQVLVSHLKWVGVQLSL